MTSAAVKQSIPLEIPGRGADAAQESFRISQQALALIEEHNTPPFPETYAFWYSYVSRTSENLVNAVDRMIGGHADISKYEIDELYNAHLKDDSVSRANERIGKKFSDQMSNVVDLVAGGANANDDFEKKLNSIRADLPHQITQDGLKQILGRLLEENQQMAERSRALHDGLTKSQEQIAQLSTELDDVRKQSTRDSLTGIANRRSFDDHLEQSIEAATKTGESLCLVMADIDHFKTVNDTFGHPVGDDVLKVFAHLVRKNVKGRDLVARYGGEEFAIILPKTQAQAALKLIDGIREQFSQKRLLLRQSREKLGQMTASFGIAAFETGLNAAEFIEKADVQLYRAKRTGRNKVCVSEISDETISE
ncbi:GGDEF domain-containing protein [Henriciella sp. AS95]|uniref:GGDEF domain-containing protein n=1 Tax=Henriciella sp. AS95 TaxID=3135782 RepID=UPI00317A07D1